MYDLLLKRYERFDPRLGRHVEHDAQSLHYASRTADRPLTLVGWSLNMPILDQGDLGSCTGNAARDCLATDPYYETVDELVSDWSESFAVALYSEATERDPWPGSYPPGDTGSSGNAVAKACRDRGLVSGYQWAFSLSTALQALLDGPVITGIPWYDSMFTPDDRAYVSVAADSEIAGGHEIAIVGMDPVNRAVTAVNSWGDSWGDHGLFHMTFDTWRTLLSMQGDVTIFTPLTAPAPIPTPPPTPAPPRPDDIDRELDVAYAKWRAARSF